MADTPSHLPKSRMRRNEPRREPATIDLSATEVRTDSPAAATAAPEASNSAEGSGAGMSSASTGATGSAADVRPTPDEVIPSDDSRLSSPDPVPPLSSSSMGNGAGASSTPPAEPRRKGLGFPSLLTAGVIGGLLGAGGTILAETWWRPRVSRVDARLAQVEERVAAMPQAAPGSAALGPIEGRMARLEADGKALAERLNAAQALAERSAKDAQEALKRPPAAQPTGADGAAGAAGVAELATRLGTLEKQAQERLAGFEKQVQERLGAIEKQLQERTQTAANIQERVTAIQEHAQAAANAAQALERRSAEQDQRLAGLAKQFSERGPEAMTATLRVTLADRLGDALQGGAPVGQTLAMLRRLDVKPDAIKPLEPYAQSAPPSAAALAQEFKPLGQRMIAETRTSSTDWGERVWNMLDKVVTVRAVGDPKSTDVANLVARIEDALARDATGEAAAAWDALPEPARRVSQDWGAKLKQRADAEAAAQKLYADSLSALETSMR